MFGNYLSEDCDVCDFCVWLKLLRGNRVANLTEEELEGYEIHLMLVHGYKP